MQPKRETSKQFYSASIDMRSCLRHYFRLGSGAVSPSGAAPRPLPSTPSRREPTLSADSIGATICARTQMTKPRSLAFGLVILSCLHCLALSESDITIVDESDIGQSQYYTTARLRSHGDQSPGHARESISPGPEGNLMDTRESLAHDNPSPTAWKKTLLLRLRWLSNIFAIFGFAMPYRSEEHTT